MSRYKIMAVAAFLATTAQTLATDLIFKSGFDPNGLVSGQVLGLGADPIQLRLSATGVNETMTLTQSGGFIFKSYVTSGDAWQVTIEQMPAQQHCNLTNASGTMTTTGDDALQVTCGTLESEWDVMNWDEGVWQ
ncbi:hypothetical protein [Marinicella litoralis]|uniref:Uncharacterized protein n=1 Tax=Marinicella litoralis TaxID=644220 RepID=A0A4R6XXF3_9GAMM|nr:hypothetical protein [Marinicella litoralis]TDR23279.1 hypothetical protein C8D91_0139 [Marinicella litoralis]